MSWIPRPVASLTAICIALAILDVLQFLHAAR
jgi:hypothetical protein